VTDIQWIKNCFKKFNFLTLVALASTLRLAKIKINFVLLQSTTAFAMQGNTT
jgi:hypothetical protein